METLLVKPESWAYWPIFTRTA